MANEILQKARERFAAQSSSALTSGEYPGDSVYDDPSSLTGNCTTVDNTYDGGSENAKGADYLVLELDVTTAPSADATAKIYWRGRKIDGSWTKWKYSHTVNETILDDGADLYDAGTFVLVYDETQLAVAAVDDGFTSVLYATPKLYESQ